MSDRGFFHASFGDLRGRPPDTCVVLPGLLLGEYPRAEDVPGLKQELGVTAVVSLQDDHDLAAKGLTLEDLQSAYRSRGIEFVRVPVADNDYEGLERELAPLVARLHALLSAGHTVLVHCNAGYNRAPTVIVAYLHAHRGLSLEEAHRFVKDRRSCVPFMTVLRRHFRRS